MRPASPKATQAVSNPIIRPGDIVSPFGVDIDNGRSEARPVTQVPGGSAYKSNARFVPQAVGVVADIAAVSTLLVGGGKAIVLTASFGAVLLGSYVIWKRWEAPSIVL